MWLVAISGGRVETLLLGLLEAMFQSRRAKIQKTFDSLNLKIWPYRQNTAKFGNITMSPKPFELVQISHTQ